MIRKHDNGGNVVWVFLLRFLERLPQRIDVIDEQRLSPIQQIVGERTSIRRRTNARRAVANLNGFFGNGTAKVTAADIGKTRKALPYSGKWRSAGTADGRIRIWR